MDAIFTPIEYGMTGKQVRDTFNTNVHALEMWANGDVEITDVAAGLTITNFMTTINTKFAANLKRINTLSGGYTTITPVTDDIATVINDNFDAIKDLADVFSVDGVPYYLDVKQATIPGKGTANILAQQDSWKLGYYTGENVLYLSADNGITWPYSIAFADGCDNIRTARVFKDGTIYIAILQNKAYGSVDLLSSLPEIICKDTDGSNLVFHDPVNALYPGAYYASFRGNSFVQDGVEVFIFGNYPHHNSYGAAPINIYRVRKISGVLDMKVVYHWGQNTADTTMLDDGTSDGGVGGNPLGDAGNDQICKHAHYFCYDQFRGEVWGQFGDDGNTIHFMKLVYNVVADTWVTTLYHMGLLDGAFRACGLTFYNNGNTAMWSSDEDKNIYIVDYAHLTSALVNHTSVHVDTQNILGLSPYGKNMMIIGGPEQPGTFAVSINYGITWQNVSTAYLKTIGALTTKNLMRLWEEDSDGYTLVHRANGTVPLYAKESYLLKIKLKPV